MHGESSFQSSETPERCSRESLLKIPLVFLRTCGCFSAEYLRVGREHWGFGHRQEPSAAADTERFGS